MTLPDTEQGCIKLIQYTKDTFYDFCILAHFEVDIGAMAVNHNGTLIASTSTRGHIIKIHATDGGQVIQELKRGNFSAEIKSLVFHPT